MLSLTPLKAGLLRSQRLPAAREYLQQLAPAILCWVGVIVLESGQVFVSDASRGFVLPSVHYIAWASFNWYALALLTPLIYHLARRYPITGSNWAVHLIFPHALACVGCLITQAIFRGIAGWLYTLHHELPAIPPELAGQWIENRGMLGVIAYWIIVIVAGFADLREEVRQRELRQAQLEARLTSVELEKLRMQIHPHFLFNTLQAAITLIREDQNAAQDVLLRLSQLLRISLDQMEANEIPLARELEFLDLYVGIQQQRFGDRLSVEIHAEPATLHLLVPPLVLQPLVENAIRHGIGKHKGADCIEVFARQQGAGLQIEVWNANSVVDESTERLFQRGVGLRNTRARLEQLYGTGASLILRPLARGGAAVLLFFPARHGPDAQLHPTAEAVS
jgi:two-component system LytT family sensor kinase